MFRDIATAFTTELIDLLPTWWRNRLQVGTPTAPGGARSNHDRLHASNGYAPFVEFATKYTRNTHDCGRRNRRRRNTLSGRIRTVHLVDPDHLLGNTAEGRTLLELVRSPRQRDFGWAKLDGLPATCRSCDVRFACNLGCPKGGFARTEDGEPGLNCLREGYQAFFRHVDGAMRFMADQLARGADSTGSVDPVLAPGRKAIVAG